MSVNLHRDEQTDAVSMMYIDEPPWHGLGTRLDGPATAAQAIRAAHLDWKVEKHPLYAKVKRDQVRQIPRRFAAMRTDKLDQEDYPALGIVGPEYKVLQNEEAFAFFDPIVGKEAAIYHTAGALGNGERIWVLAKLPGEIRVIGDDIAEKYLLLSNSHDGLSSVQVKFTPIRVVCENTLTRALAEGPTIRVAHTRDLKARMRNAEMLLGIVNKEFGSLEERFKSMLQVQVTPAMLREYLEEVFPDPRPSDDEHKFLLAKKRSAEARRLAGHLFSDGRGNDMEGVRGTLWAAYNGVTELIDHRRTQQTPDERLKSIWFGDGCLTKARAYSIAITKTKLWLN